MIKEAMEEGGGGSSSSSARQQRVPYGLRSSPSAQPAPANTLHYVDDSLHLG